MNLTLRDVQVCLPGKGKRSRAQALAGISLQVEPGEQLAVIGPSGAGKSTLLRLLATAQQPTRGQVQVLGTEPWVIAASARQKLRARIGLIQQSPPLPPRQRVLTAVAAGRAGQWSRLKSLLNLLYPLDTVTIANTLAKLDMDAKVFERCDQCSGGELQRVAIARALYQQPEIYLADEPVSAMDPVLAEHTLTLLSREARQSHATLLVSLHNLELALKYFPRVIGLRDGRILFDKATADIHQQELDSLYANEQLSGTASDPQPLTQDTKPTAPTASIPRC